MAGEGDAEIRGAADVGSCDVSDACDLLGVEAARTGALRALWPGCPVLSGRLTTVRLEPASGMPSPLPELLELLAQAAGRVVLVDLSGRLDVQCWGTVLATAAKRFGVRGALIHGAARDIEGLRALGLPAYARGVYPGAMRGRLRLVAVDEPVELDGQAVEPGAFAVADSSGLVVLAEEHVGDVAAVAAEQRALEVERLRAVETGADPQAVFSSERQPGEG